MGIIKKNFTFVFLLPMLVAANVWGQELGLNFNHNPENIDFRYVEKVPVKWIRTTPRILDYVDGKLDADTDTGIQKVVEAGKRGYRIAFGFRWDFRNRNLALPGPGSEREALYFRMVDRLLERVGAEVDIFKLGNEPNLETIESDLEVDEQGKVPLVVFTERLLDHVIAFYRARPQWKKPEIYAGSLPALFEKVQQKKPGVAGLIRLAHERKEITGLAVHLHIADTLQIENALNFVRSIMPDKPVIVPEFSLFRLYNKHLSDPIGSGVRGKAFLKKYNLPAGMKIYEWLSLVHAGKIAYGQWEEMFTSQDWYVPHYLQTYYRYFSRYHVVLATYPLLQQGYEKNVKPGSASWFLNPLFLQRSFGLNSEGEYYTNPLSYPDFMTILNRK